MPKHLYQFKDNNAESNSSIQSSMPCRRPLLWFLAAVTVVICLIVLTIFIAVHSIHLSSPNDRETPQFGITSENNASTLCECSAHNVKHKQITEIHSTRPNITPNSDDTSISRTTFTANTETNEERCLSGEYASVEYSTKESVNITFRIRNENLKWPEEGQRASNENVRKFKEHCSSSMIVSTVIRVSSLCGVRTQDKYTPDVLVVHTCSCRGCCGSHQQCRVAEKRTVSAVFHVKDVLNAEEGKYVEYEIADIAKCSCEHH